MKAMPRTLFEEEHDIFRDSVRRFIEEEIAPHHAQWEKDGQISREAWLKAGATCLGMGSKLITRELVEAGDFAGITKKVAQVLKWIQDVRKEMTS